jgi:GNAT superfamily N-acetyltransferase
MSSDIHIRDMRTEVDPAIIDDIYRDILLPSFGADELDALEAVSDGLAEGGSYEAWGLCALDGATPVGCVLGYPYVGAKVLLIGYLAVQQSCRDQGIGDLLLDAAHGRWYGETELVLAEVEDPRHHPVVADIDPKRRVTFYARRGAQVILAPYFQPRLGEGKKRVFNLFLTVLSGSARVITPENAVVAQDVTDFIREYFRDSGEGEGWPQSDDVKGCQLLAWYESRAKKRETIRLHPIGDYENIEIPALGE